MDLLAYVRHFKPSQIHAECKRFGKAYSLRSVAVYGGGSMWEQAKALQEGAEIVVCTPVSVRGRPAFWGPATTGWNQRRI